MSGAASRRGRRRLVVVFVGRARAGLCALLPSRAALVGGDQLFPMVRNTRAVVGAGAWYARQP